MIIYFDTSAFIPVLTEEHGTPRSRELWDAADDVVTSRLMYVEAAAALARAHRMGRLTPRRYRAARGALDDLWRDFDVVEVDGELTRRAAEIAEQCALRGYDAVQCASAEQVAQADLLVASNDKEMVAACADLGLATADLGP
jgi:predicted nucleic acid-binding protein